MACQCLGTTGNILTELTNLKLNLHSTRSYQVYTRIKSIEHVLRNVKYLSLDNEAIEGQNLELTYRLTTQELS